VGKASGRRGNFGKKALPSNSSGIGSKGVMNRFTKSLAAGEITTNKKEIK